MSKQKASKHVKDANSVFNEGAIYAFVTRDSQLQRAMLDRLQSFLVRNAETKRDALKAGDEDFANFCLGLQEFLPRLTMCS
jgi:hypothetical protein